MRYINVEGVSMPVGVLFFFVKRFRALAMGHQEILGALHLHLNVGAVLRLSDRELELLRNFFASTASTRLLPEAEALIGAMIVPSPYPDATLPPPLVLKNPFKEGTTEWEEVEKYLEPGRKEGWAI